MDKTKAVTAKAVEDIIPPGDFQKLLSILREVKFGTVSLIIQDGKVVQIDKLEKIRFK
ncbi:MAG: YezD family protein [Oscillospiraceae bacterium]|jgi:hypothetical protein|nr:YezD family protein [Oscillospiraceae bacterium]